MREVDHLMVEIYGITLEQMMENAGRNFADLARRQLGGRVQYLRSTEGRLPLQIVQTSPC